MPKSKSVRKITKNQFLSIVRDELIKLRNANNNPEFSRRLEAMTQATIEEMTNEIASLTYQLSDEFYELIERELKKIIRLRLSQIG